MFPLLTGAGTVCLLRQRHNGTAWDTRYIFSELTSTQLTLPLLPKVIDFACLGVFELFVIYTLTNVNKAAAFS